MVDDKYRPRTFDEMAEDPIPVSMINEPSRETIELRPGAKQRSLHAVLCEALTNTQALLARLETGVLVRPGEGREVVRELYLPPGGNTMCWLLPCGWKSWNRALLPVIGWTEVAFELLQGVAKRLPILHE
jgi:hypothetical protein